MKQHDEIGFCWVSKMEDYFVVFPTVVKFVLNNLK